MVIFLKIKCLFDVMLYTFCNKMMYVWRQKSSHLPSVQRDGQYRTISVPFPFNIRAFAVLVHFQTVLVLFQGQPSVLVNGPDGKIKRVWSLIVQEFSVFNFIPLCENCEKFNFCHWF